MLGRSKAASHRGWAELPAREGAVISAAAPRGGPAGCGGGKGSPALFALGAGLCRGGAGGVPAATPGVSPAVCASLPAPNPSWDHSTAGAGWPLKGSAPGGYRGMGGFPEPPELLPARASGRHRPPACPPFPRNPRPAVNET